MHVQILHTSLLKIEPISHFAVSMASRPCDAVALVLTAIGSIVLWSKQAQPAADGAADGMTAAEAAGNEHGSSCAAAAANAAAAENSWQGLLLMACGAAAALLLALSFTPRWQRWRACTVATLRLALFPTLPWAPQLCAAPGSWAVDAVRVIQGKESGADTSSGLSSSWELVRLWGSCARTLCTSQSMQRAATPPAPVPDPDLATLTSTSPQPGLPTGSRTFRLLFFGIGLPLDLPAHLAVHTLCLAIAIADAPRACALPVRGKHGHSP